MGDAEQHEAFDVADAGSSLQGTELDLENETSHRQVYGFHQSHQTSRPLDETDIPQFNTFGSVPPTFYDPGIQSVRSIETLDQSNVQLCGTSAELDPWLLRHCKFDDVGMRAHGKIRIRNVGGVPFDNMIPVHFAVVDDSLYEQVEPQPGRRNSLQHRREELNSLVSPEMGLRLISL